LELENIIIKSNIAIKCQTCKKIILNEFKTREIGDNTIYFCCEMCDKYFSYDENMDTPEKDRLEHMQLVCPKCNISQILPTHCNRAMHHEVIEGEDKLVCWMGIKCGVVEIPTHCGEPMEIVSKNL